MAADIVPGAPAWIIRRYPSSDIKDKMQLVRISNPFGAATFATFELTVPLFSLYANPMQPGGSFIVMPGSHCGAALQDVDGAKHLVAAFLTGNAAKEPRVQWMRFDVSAAPKLVDSGLIDPGPGLSTFNASVAINGQGDMGLIYCQVGLSEQLSVWVAGRSLADPPGTMRRELCKQSEKPLLAYGRFGDYSGISVDVKDDWFWATNQYSEGSWATWVQQFKLK